MQRYRQSIAYRQSIVCNKPNDDEGALNLVESYRASSIYRGSWNPQWMDTNHWVGKIKLPSEFMAEIYSDDDDSDNECGGVMIAGGRQINEESKMDWAQSSMKEKWFPLLCNVTRAVVHATPWDEPLSEKDREVVLLAVLDHFINHAVDREVMGAQIKELLSTIKKEKPTFEIQLALIAFMSDGTWNGEVDHYRRPENFKKSSDFDDFQEKCQKMAQDRLHQINSQISKVEAKIAAALKHWTSVKQSCSCYGGGRHSQASRQSIAPAAGSHNDRMSIADIRRAQSNRFEPPQTSPEGKVVSMIPNVINVKMESVQVCGINPSTGKWPVLASNMEILIQYFHGNKEVESKDIKGKAQFKEQDRLVFRNASETTFTIPSSPLPNGNGELENLDRCYFKITIEEKKMCGIFGGKHLAQVHVPLRTLYEGISPLDSKDRQKVIKERKAKDDKRELGIHFSKNVFEDNNSGVGLEVSLSMTCTCDIHNRQPPSVNILQKEREQSIMSDRRSEVGEIDHHKAARDLSEILGELNDAEMKALQRYCDRYLVHDELCQILSLKGFATSGNFSNKETRDGMKDAVNVIVSMKGSFVTRECEIIAEEVLSTVKRQCLERILDIDEVCKEGSDQGPDVIRASKKILESLSVSAGEIEKAVRERALEIAEHFSHKLQKLLYLFPAGAEGKDFIPLDGCGNRMSVLIELAQKEDSGTILAKARTFYEIMDNGFYVMCHLLEFAMATKDDLIIKFATYRMDVCLEKITPILSTAVTAFFAELIRSKQFDPLGDAFGVVTLLYQKVMEVVAMIDEIPELEERCLFLVSPFKDYLPTWFSLCLVKTPLWAKTIVQSEPLEAISAGKIFCNEAAASMKSLMDALFGIFDKVVGWRDPEESFLYITSFSKLIGSLSESFCQQLIEKGKYSEDPIEWMVCCATLIRFEISVQLFWEDKIFTGIVKEFGDNDGILHYQCHAVKASSIAELSDIKDNFFAFVGQMIEGAAGIFFSTASEEAAGITGITSKGSESFNRAFSEIVSRDINRDINIITENTDQATATPVLRVAVTGLHKAFQSYVFELSPQLDEQSVKPHFYAALQAIENSLKPLEEEGVELVPQELLFDLSHKSRALVHLVCQSSADLIQSLDGKRGNNVNGNERVRLIEILQSRTSDKVASLYLQNL